MDQKSTLLIIDDTSENINILSALFKDQYSVKAALNGRQGLKLAAECVPDLILLDIFMPEMDGFEVCRQMKSDPVLNAIPIVFLTARTEVQDKIKAFSEGGVDYITKPFEPEEVRARVNTHVELRKARELIQRYNNELESMLSQRTTALVYSERQAAFGQLVQGIVHNLASPLTGIMGNQQYMQLLIKDCLQGIDKTDDQNTQITLLEEIEKSNEMIGYSANMLNQITQSLLAKSRTDKMENIRRIDLNEILRLEIDFLQSDLRFKHNIDKEILLSDLKLEIEASPAEVIQVFQNIVNNALDALYPVKSKKLTIRTGRLADQAFFEVSDNGSGIPEKYMNQIFDPFFSTKAKHEELTEHDTLPVGTGLGLWTCKQTVKSYGGSIDFDSASDRGTRFTVYLPLIK